MRELWARMTKERLFKPEYAKELLSLARSDLATGKYLSKSTKIRPENTLFHIGQAVEKSLKAVLCHLQMPVPLTHDLLALIQTLPKEVAPPGDETLDDLSPYATVRRYEEGKYEISVEELDSAIRLAEQVIQWAAKHIEAKR